MHAVVHDTGEEWFNLEQLRGLGTLMSKNVVGLRTHALPRRCLDDHYGHQGCNRLTLMLKKSGDVDARDDGVDGTSVKMSEEWGRLDRFLHGRHVNLGGETRAVSRYTGGVDQGSIDQA